MRLDNGLPWGSRVEHLPTGLVLWLAGLGVSVLFNPPRTPQDNGVVERCNGTGQRWAEVPKCHTAAELQEKVDFADRIQRERLRSVQGQSRREAFPGLTHSGRAYSQACEEENWDLSKAEALLEGYAVLRKVSSQGQVRIYNRRVSLGKHHAGRQTRVQYDSGSKMWVISAAEDSLALRCVPATEVTRERIFTLALCEQE
jgi:transposase InsO family protein